MADLRKHAVHEDIVSQTRESLALFTEAVNARNGLLEPAKAASLFETHFAKPWRTNQ